MENILVGTASWTDATLVRSGRFYPADAKTPEQRLRFYAGQFPVPAAQFGASSGVLTAGSP